MKKPLDGKVVGTDQRGRSIVSIDSKKPIVRNAGYNFFSGIGPIRCPGFKFSTLPMESWTGGRGRLGWGVLRFTDKDMLVIMKEESQGDVYTAS